MDGSLVSLKNAKRLLADAKLLFDNHKNSGALANATLALEELGKGLILWEAREKNRTIDKNTWVDELEGHKNKLLAIPKNLKKFSDPNNTLQKRKLAEMESFLQRLSKKKLEAVYVDWDASKNEWFLYDEKTTKEKRKDAKEALDLAKWAIKGYLRDGDLITERIETVIQMVNNKNVHAVCDTCFSVMRSMNQVLIHRQTWPDHKIGFRKN